MKILVVSSHTQSLLWFRIDLMQDIIKKGHLVIAVGPDYNEDIAKKFREKGVIYKKLFVQRNGINPLNDLKTFFNLINIITEEKPEKIFVYQAKTIIYTALAARFCNIKEVYPLVAGLGSIFLNNSFKFKILKNIILFQYFLSFKFSKKVFFQNIDDLNYFCNRKIVEKKKCILINGSGVNLEKFKESPLPEKDSLLFIGRLLKDKGVVEYLEACRRLKEKYKELKCVLVGPFDSNPTSLTKSELQKYIDENIIEYKGEQEDVIPFLKNCSIFVLPSYYEGTPKSVLEAMAVGRPIITTNVPGCKETVIDGLNGFLVEPKNVDQIVEKIKILLNNKNLKNKMAEESKKLVKKKFDVKEVNEKITRIMGI